MAISQAVLPCLLLAYGMPAHGLHTAGFLSPMEKLLSAHQKAAVAVEMMADAISMTFVAAVAVPAGIGLVVGDAWYIRLAAVVLLQAVAIEVAKPYLTDLGTWTLRPARARACDALCRGGAAGGAPGFPSGHMAAATLLVAALWLHTRRPVVLWIGGPWLVAMAWARWSKECHSLVQIVGGVVVGATTAKIIA